MAGSNQFGSWTDADETSVENLLRTDGGVEKLQGGSAAEKAYSSEKGYIDIPYDDAALREARKTQVKEKTEEGKEAYPLNTSTFADRTGQLPKQEYENSSSVNFSAKRNHTSHYLDLAGTVAGVSVGEYSSGIASRYPLNQVIETRSGHVIEYNDTPENPRILIKHTSGSGIDMRPDGTMVVSSKGDGKVEVNHGGHKLVVTGDGQLHFTGDLNLNVGGDFNVNVGGSYNVQAKEETKTINGPSRDLYFGNKYTSIVGSRQDITTENYTSAALGFRDVYTKGDHKTAVEGGATISAKGSFNMSSQAQLTQSAPDMNIAAESLSVFGDTGTIGGENIIMYNYNMHTGHSVWAGDTMTTTSVYADETMTSKEFIGSLTGNADTATQSGISGGPGGSAGTKVTGSAQTQDTTATALPTNGLLQEYLHKGGYGIQKIFVDKGDHLKGAYDKTRDTGGVTKRILTTAETRARLRDSGHRSNPKFGSYQGSNGTINPEYTNSVPSSVAYSIDPKNTVQVGRTKSVGAIDSKVRVKTSANLTAPISVDPRFDPASADQILSTTSIARGVTLSQFLYGKGDKGKLDPAFRLEEKRQLVRNLIPQANLVRSIQDNQDLFKGYNLEIIEGVYFKESTEAIAADGMLDLRSNGRAVVYEVISPEGIIDKDKTFDLAVWLATNIRYEKIILDYDELDPSGGGEDINVQIIVIMPMVAPDFTAEFKMETETLFNNVSQGKEFIKIGDSVKPLEETVEDNREGEAKDDGEDEPADDAADDNIAAGLPNTRTSGSPEVLDGKFKSDAEVEAYLLKNKVNKQSNGYSFVFEDKQFWVTVNPVEIDRGLGDQALQITSDYESHLLNQRVYGPVAGRDAAGKAAFEDGLW